MTPPDDIEWLDDDAVPVLADEELPGQDRPPRRRRRQLTVGVLGAAALAAAITAAVVVGHGHDRETAAPSPTPSASSPLTASPLTPLPIGTLAVNASGIPMDGLAAIRTAFPGASVNWFVSSPTKQASFGYKLTYNVTTSGRTVTVSVTPLDPAVPDRVLRTSNSVEIGQELGRARVDVRVLTAKGRTTRGDFVAVQALVQDARLLATP